MKNINKESHVCDITQQLTTSEPENPALGGGGATALRMKKENCTAGFCGAFQYLVWDPPRAILDQTQNRTGSYRTR